MKFPKKIAQKFNEYMIRADDLNIEGWSFKFNDARSISAGLVNNYMGGPYSPPSGKTTCSGSAYIIWRDGRISKGQITQETIENLDGALKKWKEISFTDSDAPNIQEPLPMPKDLKIKDENVNKIIKEDSSYLFEILDYYNQKLAKKENVKMLNAKAGAGFNHSTIMNSKGMVLEWEETTMFTYANINNKYSDSYYKRNAAKKKDLNTIILEIEKNMTHSQKKIKAKSDYMPIILMPDVLGSFLGKYLLGSNLNGMAVAHNMSLYEADDFKRKKQVFDKKLNIIIDGLEDYAIDTIPCSSMGIPSSKQYIIAGGRLITPFLGLQYSNKLGMSTTSQGAVKIDAGQGPFESIISDVDYGLIIYDVLGVHTQNAKDGRYSLAVSNGLVVEDGLIRGTIEQTALISGNFLDSLNDKETKFAEYRKGEVTMRMKGDVMAKT
ncbi:MAG: metallopeptidase TldD-related protein [Nanoarchaeota archaeon]|nr:metallopeptidase TldD-related protein [Nanoarchaeota archaeon]